MTAPHDQLPDVETFAGTDEILQRLGYKPFKRPLITNSGMAANEPSYATSLHAFQRDHGLPESKWTKETGIALQTAATRHYLQARALGLSIRDTTMVKLSDLLREIGWSKSDTHRPWMEWVDAHGGPSVGAGPSVQQVAALADAVIVHRHKIAVAILNQAKEKEQMATIQNDPSNPQPTPVRGFVDSTKNALQAGIQMGIGAQALKLAMQGTTKMLLRAGVPKDILKLPLVKTLLLVGSPTILRLAAGKIPGLSHPKVLAVLELAETSAYAEVTKDVVGLLVKQAGPLLKGLSSLGESLMLDDAGGGKDLPVRVSQVDPIDIEETTGDAAAEGA